MIKKKKSPEVTRALPIPLWSHHGSISPPDIQPPTSAFLPDVICEGWAWALAILGN